jgi:hypothetical protein
MAKRLVGSMKTGRLVHMRLDTEVSVRKPPLITGAKAAAGRRHRQRIFESAAINIYAVYSGTSKAGVAAFDPLRFLGNQRAVQGFFSESDSAR